MRYNHLIYLFYFAIMQKLYREGKRLKKEVALELDNYVFMGKVVFVYHFMFIIKAASP